MKKYLLFILLFYVVNSYSQITIDLSPPYDSPVHLIDNVLLGGGVTASNHNYQGDSIQIGFFDATNTSLGINSGIVMATGEVSALDPTFTSAFPFLPNTVTDPDLLNVALVQQEVFLFSDSILNNISLYEESITKNQIVQASKEIGIHEFIMSLPNGFNYVVGERGVTLSSGQRQLIAFLRVYVRNPKILILDEATASIDSSTEALLQNALKKLSENRTTIVIAHRLSTIVNADKILLLEEGKILEEGTHRSLIDLKGEYYKMYQNQIND